MTRSHAHEEDIPGTVNLRAQGMHPDKSPPFLQTVADMTDCIEGDDTGYGQALFPAPAEDPNDPLQVRLRSTMNHAC